MEKNPEESENEDEDVRMEKARVKEALTCQSCEEVSFRTGTISDHELILEDELIQSLFSVSTQKPAVVVSNLRKQYKGRREGFSLNKTRKLATKNVSFCVRKGLCGRETGGG